MERFAKKAAVLLSPHLPSPIEAAQLATPPDRKLGDFAFPCFRLAKELRLAPPQIAQNIAQKVQAAGLPPELKVTAAGPYVNFTVTPEAALAALLPEMLAGNYGRFTGPSRGRWVIEYSSPNVAKPFQIYHLRTTIVGAALARIGKFRGYDVTSINHLGDWGTQYGKIAVAVKLYGDELPAEPSIEDLVRIYVKFHSEAEKRPELEDQAREAFLKLEKGDPEITALWKKCVDISMKEFSRIYSRLNVEFDHYWGESHYKDQLEPLLARLRKDGLLVESEGAWVVPVTDRGGREIPPCILQKGDGASIYATRDLAAALYRYEKFHFDRMIYVVGAEQKLHFEQVFGVLRRMNLKWEGACQHIATGLYRFKDAKMSTRKGNYVTLEEMLETAREKVAALMATRDAGASEDAVEAVALGAVIFHDLSTDPTQNVEFDTARVVDFEGETGPYLQYAHTRCLSILRKSGQTPTFRAELLGQLKHPEEVLLVKLLGQFPDHLERVLELGKPSQLAHYLIDVVKQFGAFYRDCHVLSDDVSLTQARLLLVDATRQVLARGLGLMGIPLPERM